MKIIPYPTIRISEFGAVFGSNPFVPGTNYLCFHKDNQTWGETRMEAINKMLQKIYATNT